MTGLTWLYLSGAILSEVFGTMSLRMGAAGRTAWYGAMLAAYVVAFALIALALGAGMPLGVGYGIWVAAGVALTALLSRLVFGEPLTRLMLIGIGLISAGVLLVEIGAAA